MELNAQLIELQGLLISVQKTTGMFTKIKLKAENEEQISYIIKTIKEYFKSKGYINANKINSCYENELIKITHFLILNTSFKINNIQDMEKEFSHLINTGPQLSVCVLANIIIELELVTCCCSIISALPIELREQLLEECVTCLKFCNPNKNLNDTCIFLNEIIQMISNSQDNDYIQKLTYIVLEMLANISGMNPEVLENWSTRKTNELMGCSLVRLFKLLCKCPITVSNLKRIILELIGVCLKIMDAVTVNIYCFWFEVTYEEEELLQTVIANEAYRVVEHLQKYKPAHELLKKLSPIARKPKTLQEIILESDVPSIIKKIDKQDADQNLWFRALMNTDVLKNEETRTCLDKWSHLCIRNDVAHLLNMSVNYEDNNIKMLVLKCAKQLNIKELAFVSFKYFHERNTNNLDMGAVDEELKLLLNKMEKDSKLEENFIRSIYLLLLQNPSLVLNNLFKECIKNSVYTKCLKDVFENIKNFAEMHSLAKDSFIAVFKSQPPTLLNVVNYKELLNLLIELSYFRDGLLLFEVFQIQLEGMVDETQNETLLYTLKVLNSISITHNANINAIPMITTLLNIMEKFRSQFFTFNNIYQEITQEAVNCFLKFSNLFRTNSNSITDDLFNRSHSKLNEFYIATLSQDKNDVLFYIYPTFSVENHAAAVAKLLKVLPMCVTTEWVSITKTLESHFSYNSTLKLLTDTLILLCKAFETQKNVDNIESVKNGLKHCLQQYGVVIKDVLQPKYKDLENEVLLTKSVCYLLKSIPKDIRKTEGLGLVHLFSNQSLLSLKEDKTFLISVIAIEDCTISQIIGERMLS